MALINNSCLKYTIEQPVRGSFAHEKHFVNKTVPIVCHKRHFNMILKREENSVETAYHVSTIIHLEKGPTLSCRNPKYITPSPQLFPTASEEYVSA